jgi:hypothetical protein
MKRTIIISAAVILIFLVGLVAFINYPSLRKNSAPQFHVGVTFGGDNSADAKILIDRVKDYTNLFVVASGPLQNNITELEHTCDYAVKSGLDIIVYFGSYEALRNTTASFIDTAKERWGNHFLGIYYGDEPSGKALDRSLELHNVPNLGNVSKTQYGIEISQTAGSSWSNKYFSYSGEIGIGYFDSRSSNTTTYYPNGTITLSKNYGNDFAGSEYLIYLPNGTTLKQESLPTANNNYIVYQNGTTIPQLTHLPWPKITFSIVEDKGDFSQFEPYLQLWNSRPFQTIDDLSTVAKSYVSTQQETTDWIANQSNVRLFTSDYVLHWWDYQIGYDTVFAQLGWNNTVSQEIGLVRGAANLQDKSWGTIITWKYTQPPYLTSGDEMYEQMLTSYECGAKYVVVFNYADGMDGPYGTLQDAHFQALQRFWNEVVQNSSVVHRGIKVEAVLVLPKDYGWGMRNPSDTIWGLWNANSTSPQIWTQLQSKLAQYGSRLDIVYYDSAYPVVGNYSQIYYWTQTG